MSPPTVQSDVPDGTQTENVGDTLLGDADRVILAVSLVPLVSQTQMSNPTVVCGSTELMFPTVCTLRHRVPGGGVGVVVGVGVAVDVGVGVAVGDLSVPPGVKCCLLVLCAGEGCGSAVLGDTGTPGLGCGRTGGLGLELGWVLGGTGGVVCAAASRAASTWSTGIPSGRCARPLARMAVRMWGNPLLVEAGERLAATADEQGFAAARRVPCTPVRSMLTAP